MLTKSELSIETLAANPISLKSSTQRIQGVDSIRCICAFVVILGHLGLTAEPIHGSAGHGASKVLIGLFNSLFNGPAAVIVFFIVSGFCIHFPFRNQEELDVKSFLCRRFLRIVPPALASLMIMKLILGSHASILDTVLWSIICEAVYYALYPFLLLLRRKLNWILIIASSYGVAAVLIATHLELLRSSQNAYIAFGIHTWVIGLPCWLLGCWLAEHYLSPRFLSQSELWLIRGIVFGISVILRGIKFHGSSAFASNCILLDLFAPLACYWVWAEISYASRNGATKILERIGSWSYSLYLVHPLVIPLLALSTFTSFLLVPEVHLLLFAIVMLASYGFYWAVEAPSHRLAVFVGRSLRRRTA